jgi:hypothetical protein
MKLNATTLPVETSLANATSAFSIKTTAKAFKILSDGLYKNKILAFVRELSRNAYDSHIAAGRKNVPFEIHLPNMLEPFFHVKDFGTGLSHENVIHLYTTYFESTKTDSNDFVGALGLGSKSPFSYASNFTVKSRFDGVESIYTCFLSEAGVPSIVKMGEGKYVGHPGLEVVIPIDKNDFNNVKLAVRQDLTFWDGTLPSIVGDSSVIIEQPKKVISGKGWYTSGNRIHLTGVTVAVQGNVGYPISIDILRGKTQNDSETAALNIIRKINPVMTFDIGKLDVTASREELSYDDPTIRNIIERICQVITEFTEKFKSEIAEVVKEATEITFRQKACELIERYSSAYGSDFISFYSNKIPTVTWKNKSFALKDLTETSHTFYIKGLSDFLISNTSSRFRGNRERFTRVPHGNVIYVDPSVKADLTTVHNLVKNRQGWTSNYTSYGVWDTHRAVNPRRMRDYKSSYENQVSTKRGGTTFTSWEFPIVSNRYAKKATVILNDQQTFGHLIIGQYMIENNDQTVYVIDYHKRSTTPGMIKKFVDSLTVQLSGFKILTASQLVLKTPVVRPTRASKTAGIVAPKNVDDVTFFQLAPSPMVRNLTAKTIVYNTYAVRKEVKFECWYDSSFDHSVDFSTGDFYYFYELRNKMYLDKTFNTRVNPLNYLNALRALGVLPAGASVVGLRPNQITKIEKNKKRGKLIAVEILDKKMREAVRTNQRLVDAYTLSKAGSQSGIDPLLMELLQGEEIQKYIETKYGDITSGKTKVAFFDQLAPVLQIAATNNDFNVSRAATVLELIHYYTSGTDKYYTDAWVSIFGSLNVTDATKDIKERIAKLMGEFHTKNPMVKHLSLNSIRYSAQRVQNQIELIEELIRYTEFRNSKKV